jgi:hypothetical protein
MADMILLIHNDFAPLIHVQLFEGQVIPDLLTIMTARPWRNSRTALSYLNCHAERSEASRCPARETLRFAQGDTKASSLVAIEKCRNP